MKLELYEGLYPRDELQLVIDELRSECFEIDHMGMYGRRADPDHLVPLLMAILHAVGEISSSVVADQLSEGFKKITKRVRNRPGVSRVQLKYVAKTDDAEFTFDMPEIREGEQVNAFIDGAFIYARKHKGKTEVVYSRDFNEWISWWDLLKKREQREKDS